MKKVIAAFLLLILSTSGAQETRTRSSNRSGQAAGYASRDATVLSIVGWGLAITVGIATLFSLLDNNPSSGSGGGSHTH